MTTYIVDTVVINAGTGQSLAAGDELIVGRNGTVGSTGTVGISGSDNSFVQIFGQVFAKHFAIRMNGSNSSVTVARDALIASASDSY